MCSNDSEIITFLLVNELAMTAALIFVVCLVFFFFVSFVLNTTQTYFLGSEGCRRFGSLSIVILKSRINK